MKRGIAVLVTASVILTIDLIAASHFANASVDRALKAVATSHMTVAV